MKTLMVCLLLGAASMLSFKTDSANGYEPGDTAIDFSLKNATDNINGLGKNASLKDYKDAKGYIVVFTCNHCPFSVAYEDRLIALHNKYATKGYPLVAINPNDIKKQPADSYDNMVERAKEKKFPFAYLYDNTQAIALAYGAKRTPHVFLLKKEGAKNIVKFTGAIDDNSWNEEAVKTKYLENALDALLGNEPIQKKTAKAVGCTIKWAN